MAAPVTTPGADDTSAPSMPTGVTALVRSSSQVDVDWTASTDDVGVQGYKVYRNGTYLSAVGPVGSSGLSDTGLTSGTTYSYTVSAIDAAANESVQSLADTAIPGPDLVAPSVPTGLTATAPAWNAVDLSWTASTDNIGVTRYTISRDGTVVSVVAGSITTFTDRSTSPITAYSYTVEASDAAGNTSNASMAAPVTTPIQVEVFSPEDGVAVFGEEDLSAFVSSGNPTVTYAINGVTVGSSTTAPYSITWDTTTLHDGSHSIVATAQDGTSPPVSSVPVTFDVANALDPATKVATDYSRGLIGADTYVLEGAYGIVAPTRLSGRYTGVSATEGTSLVQALLTVSEQASPAIRSEMVDVLTQPLRGTMYAPIPNMTLGRVDPDYPECIFFTSLFGGTTNYCEHTSTHFRIKYVLGGGPQAGPDDVDPTDVENENLTATGCDMPDHCNGVPDYIDRISKALEESWRTYTVALGYDEPVGANPLLDVSIHSFAGGAGGQVIPPAYVIEITNASLHPMHVARHEFFHRVQYMYLPDLWGLVTANRCPWDGLVPDFAHCLPQWRWWMEATAEWAAIIAQDDSLYDDPNPSPPQAAQHLASFFERPNRDLESTAVEGDQYGKFILADYMARSLTGPVAVRETFESIRAQGSGGSAKAAIEEVAVANGSTLAALFDGFARANWEQDYTPVWSEHLSSPSTVADDLGPARPARQRRDVDDGETISGSVLIGQGGAHYVQLVPPAGGHGVFNLSIGGIYGGGVDVQVVTYSSYSPPTKPTVCTSVAAAVTEAGVELLSMQVPPGCRYAALIFTQVAFAGDSFREFGWSATYGAPVIHETFDRPDRSDGTGWGTADSGQSWVANEMQDVGTDTPFTLGGISGGKGFINVPGENGCCSFTTASIRSPVFLGAYDFLMLGHFGDVSGPHTDPGSTRVVFGDAQGLGAGLDGEFYGTSGSTHVDTTQPFYLRWHVDPSKGLNAYKVWSAAEPEPQAWTGWSISVYGPWSGRNWLRIQTHAFDSPDDFARLYIDQIDMWATSP